MNGLSYDEIAEVLSLEPGTVKSRLFRARKRVCAAMLNGNISASDASKEARESRREAKT
jgi:DNA-directed RNA polymerase specialized sigma24 family protein